ncbi:MAG: ABC transporter substrate-binding protein, partial [Trebonia sp.]
TIMRSRYRRLLPVAIGLVTLAGVAACSSSGDSPSASSRSASSAGSSAAKGSPIRIGLASPLTGSSPSEGTSELAIAKYAVSVINGRGGIDGHQVELVTRDTGGVSPTGAVSAFESLSSDGVPVVLGEYTSTNFQAACTIAMAQHVVLIGHATATNGLTDGKTYCFRDTYQVAQSTGAMFEIAKKMGWNPIAIAADTTSFGASENSSFTKLAASYGIKIAADVTWSSPASSLTSQVLKLNQSGAKAIFVGSPSGPDVTLLAKTMVQNGVKLPLVGPGGIDAVGVPAAAGSAYDQLGGVYDLTSYDSQVPAAKQFMDEISKRTGITQGGGNPTRLYDAFMIAAAGLAKTGGQGGTALVNALQSLGKFPVAVSGGPGTFTEFTATQHTALFGPHMLTIYKWESATNSFAVDESLSTIADTSPGVNG